MVKDLLLTRSPEPRKLTLPLAQKQGLIIGHHTGALAAHHGMGGAVGFQVTEVRDLIGSQRPHKPVGACIDAV